MTEPLWIDLLDPDVETLLHAIQGEVHPSALARLEAPYRRRVGAPRATFKVPEFGWRYAYAWSWSLIVVTTAAQIVYFRRKRWI